MNKKAQLGFFYGIGMAFICIVAVVALIEPVKSQITIARNATYLNCTNPNLGIGESGTCILTDWWLFMFVLVGFSAAIYQLKKES